MTSKDVGDGLVGRVGTCMRGSSLKEREMDGAHAHGRMGPYMKENGKMI